MNDCPSPPSIRKRHRSSVLLEEARDQCFSGGMTEVSLWSLRPRSSSNPLDGSGHLHPARSLPTIGRMGGSGPTPDPVVQARAPSPEPTAAGQGLVDAKRLRIQNASSRRLGLHARVDDVTVADVGRALKRDKTLLTIWAMRGAPTSCPLGEAAIFTAGALPVGEDHGEGSSCWLTSRERDGRSPHWCSGQPKRRSRSSTAASWPLKTCGRRSPSACRRSALVTPVWRPRGSPRTPVPGDRTATSRLHRRHPQDDRRDLGAHRPMARRTAAVARPGRRPPNSCGDTSACYGPSTQRAFAEWTLRSAADVRTTFEAIMSELVEIRVERTDELLLAADLDDLASPAQPTGVRLLPAQDPFLQQRDRQAPA